jgi:hypothetical protein
MHQSSNYQTFAAPLLRFGKQGEKTGWFYIQVPAEVAVQMHPADKKVFRVKGWLNEMPIAQVALMPMGEGDYVLPVNAAMRKHLKAPLGAIVQLRLCEDDSAIAIAADLLACLEDVPEARTFFESLAPSHKKYFSKWIEDAKTMATRTRRLTQAVEGLSHKMDFGTMIKWGRTEERFGV